jgi:starch-binding outer membrane protein, SusD/RagB family
MLSQNKWKDIIQLSLIIGFSLTLSSCKKYLKVDAPPNQVLGSSIFADDITATTAITGIYSTMMQQLAFNGNITLYTGLESDELKISYSFPALEEINNNSIQKDNSNINTIWNNLYSYIYMANSAIEGLGVSSLVSDSTKRRLVGEAKFIRSFCYFYLVNLFGDVPLVLETNYQTTSVLPRSALTQVYQQIISDLRASQDSLTVAYTGTEKIRPNKWTATALLSRVYLYLEDWNNAETQASMVINSPMYILTTLTNVFKKNNSEAIWQLLPVNPSFNTQDGNQFIATSGTPNYFLLPSFINSFENNDSRKGAWTKSNVVGVNTYYYPYKYTIKSGGNPLGEYLVVLRLAELYLIRAEARAKASKLVEAANDINMVRTRAGLLAVPTTLSQAELLAEIEKQRRLEFFCEMGHRWFDLKRTKKADTVLGPLKPSWDANDVLWPIPLSQINANPFLTQNPGY